MINSLFAFQRYGEAVGAELSGMDGLEEAQVVDGTCWELFVARRTTLCGSAFLRRLLGAKHGHASNEKSFLEALNLCSSH